MALIYQNRKQPKWQLNIAYASPWPVSRRQTGFGVKVAVRMFIRSSDIFGTFVDDSPRLKCERCALPSDDAVLGAYWPWSNICQPNAREGWGAGRRSCNDDLATCY